MIINGKTNLPWFKFLIVLVPWLLVIQHLLQQVSAASDSTVKFLPGFDGPLPFVLETGYIGVDESENVQLFYYFFQSETNPKEDPILLWLTGGPGCSGISAILYENGPLRFEPNKYNGSLPTLELNPYSWTKVANIIFLDLPVGTGFSYATTTEASHSGDFKASHNANEFLRKWLIHHREFRSNPVYLGGDSYTGLTLPVYFQEMSQGNDKGEEPFINLKGYLLGNPGTNNTMEYNFIVPFAHGMALISDELYESLQRHCKGNYNYQSVDPTNIECNMNLQAFYKCISGLQVAHILEPFCPFASPTPSHDPVAKLRRALYQEHPKKNHHLHQEEEAQNEPSSSSSSSLSAFTCRSEGYILAYYWLNDKSVQQAIHVREGSIGQWIRCNYGLNYTNDLSSSVQYHKNISETGNYRSLIYSGDHDMIVNYLGTQAWIRSLNYSIAQDWRPWFVQAQVAGYTRTYSNKMTYATVKGGGHTAPEYRPQECFTMFKRWISGHPL